MPPSFFKNMCETTLNIQSTYKVGQNTAIKIECYNPTYRGEISPHLPHAIRRGEAFDHRPTSDPSDPSAADDFFPHLMSTVAMGRRSHLCHLQLSLHDLQIAMSGSGLTWTEEAKKRRNLFHGKFQTGKQFFVKFEGSNRGSWNITTTTKQCT